MTRFIKSYNKFSIQNQSQQKKNVRFRLLIFRVRILMYFVLLGKLVFIVRVVEWLVFFQRGWRLLGLSEKPHNNIILQEMRLLIN